MYVIYLIKNMFCDVDPLHALFAYIHALVNFILLIITFNIAYN